ncbi:hypothetical protein AALP_AA1G020200 [Arabis alpina]|uniref:Integrase catalytic domain-containing protein n=1 Tax=Arabis alpina TaxID=50452 RepID=A0A087HKH9_ARAAL|nr:hypothetical protein AALP_AA1G020200 [Arabis alpina]
MEDLRAKLTEITSKVHHAISSAPEIERVLAETQQTPFTDRIMATPVRDSSKLRISHYTGDTDPMQHLRKFNLAMGRTHYSLEEKDAGCCQHFVEHLSGPALEWFARLRPRSIDSFPQLSQAFLKHYSMYLEEGISDANFWSLVQKEDETLRGYMDRFKAVLSRVTVGDNSAISALKQGLWYESMFRENLVLTPPTSLKDAMHRSTRYIRLEEDKTINTHKHSLAKPPAQKAKPKGEGEYQEPRQHYDQEYKSKKLLVHQVGTDQPPQRQSNKWIRGQDSKDTKLYCDYHQVFGHSTTQCRGLKDALLTGYQRGEIKVDSPPDRGEKRKGGENSGQGERKNNPAQPLPPKEGPRDGPPTSKRRVLVIMGGLQPVHASVQSLKKYEKMNQADQDCYGRAEVDMPIIFSEADTKDLAMPHNDPLVIELKIEDCNVTRVLIDTGSAVDVIFKDTLKRMDIPDGKIKPSIRPLVGFEGITTMTVGTIKLRVYAGGLIRDVKFLVVDKSAVYNVIMGTPWLFSLRAIASTYHQCVKFPTPTGVHTIRGDQKAARTCFITGQKLQKFNLHISNPEESNATEPRQELATPVNIDPQHPERCVNIGEFLGYIVTQRGIEANPKQITAIIDLPSPKNKRELLRGNKTFVWDDKCEAAFNELKSYLTSPPVLSKPEHGGTLYLYVSVTNAAVSGVLIREDRGDQKPIFYVSKSLNGAESRYPTLEKLALAIVVAARKLRPYFQSHTIAVMSTQPLRTILHSPSQSGRMAKWAVELSEYDIEYRNRTSTKSQALADFLIELPPEAIAITPTSQDWSLYIDGSASRHGCGAGIRLISPTNEILEQCFRLEFKATNNEAEWEALIAGLRLAREVGVKRVHAYNDSRLVTNQLNHDYDARDERMNTYLKLTEALILSNFDNFVITDIPRSENFAADDLASLATSSGFDLKRIIPVKTIPDPSIDLPCSTSRMNVIKNDSEIAGTDDDLDRIDQDGRVPEDKWAARRLKSKSAHYVVMGGKLYKWSAAGVLLQCVNGDTISVILTETHEGGGGNHSGVRTLAMKIKKLGFYWPTMLTDCADYARRCEKCQCHGTMINSPTEPLTTATSAYPFMRWAMDIFGPLPRSKQKQYVIVVTDYFTKWVEAESFAKIKADNVQDFVWKFVICRHGLPYEIIADNGSQFISKTFEDFCSKWKIRLNKSTPRFPQENGQAEATNKAIISELKKRFDEKKGTWADELDGVLWSLRTTPRQSTKRTPFSLAYGIEAMAPAEVSVNSLRREIMTTDPDLNDRMLMDNLDHIEEERGRALVRIQNYQQIAARYYNKRVRSRSFSVGDLVLRKVYENTAEYKAGKLGAHWEGPYQVSKIVRPGVYELMTMDGAMIPRSWNAMSLKRYYYNLLPLNEAQPHRPRVC